MRTWKSLEDDFSRLSNPMQFVRLDFQWGAAGDRFTLAGPTDPTTERKFWALAGMAGGKLEELIGLAALADIPKTDSDEERWILALRLLSGSVRDSHYAEQLDNEGNSLGLIFMGSIDRVADASASLCLTLEGMSAPHTSRPFEAILSAPRYRGVNDHWVKAQQFRQQEQPDLANAAKEAISALEGMAQLLVGQQSATLGDCLKKIRNMNRCHPALVKCLEALWGYTSEAPGVRHGSATPVNISVEEADFVMSISQSAIRYLLAADR
jgi:hypothetical protein